MAQIAAITLKMPKWRIRVMLIAVKLMVAGVYLRLITVDQAEASIPHLAAWAVRGIRVI